MPGAVSFPYVVSALDVVVYAAPGPPETAISRFSQDVVQRVAPCQLHGTLGYVVLVRSDFARLWQGVASGDLAGAAYDTLRCLGPDALRFMTSPGDWVFAWVGQRAGPYGRMLLLQVLHDAALTTSRN